MRNEIAMQMGIFQQSANTIIDESLIFNPLI